MFIGRVALKEENGSSVHYDGSDADSERENNRDEEGANVSLPHGLYKQY